MFLNRIYYNIKPLIPRSLQILLRRQLVLRKRKLYNHIWPIDEKAGKPPAGWKGWPGQKKFALVLMHDVDTLKGHNQCYPLMDIEETLGFRSSFNFVPERYTVSQKLRNDLNKRGFEVGVHGLNHDGKLFSSKRVFMERSKKINAYLKEWEAVGFSSPSMHRNLNWMHALNIMHATSTFDTDPFEPQPDGVGAIFPFWVQNNSSKDETIAKRDIFSSDKEGEKFNRRKTSSISRSKVCSLTPHHGETAVLQRSQNGYVELPYTLPQDFTLFVLMEEPNINIWKEKLDWIAEKGGMALLNTHPDYINFKERKSHLEDYPVKFYQEFLEYLQSRYADQYWNALPSQMACFWE